MDIYDQIRRDEGLRLKPYQDTVGKTTIGYGRNLSDKGISQVEADFLLHNDVEAVTNELQTRLPYFNALDPVRQAVLTNMAFNMGFNGLEGFSNMLRCVALGDWTGAAAEMVDSVWSREVGPRATRLAEQMTSGQ